MTLSSYLRGGLFGTFSPSALDTAKSWAADPPMIEEQRGTLVPGMIPRHVAGAQPRAELAVPGILHDPYMAMARLFDAAGAERLGMPSDDRQNARDAFDVAGLAAMGGFGMPKPANAPGSAGGKLRGYHGMDSDAGLDFAKNVRGRFWSSSSPDVASEYAAHATDGIAPRVMPVDMDFKNPLVLTSDGAPHWSAIPFEGKRLATDAIADIAVSRGHDGLVLRNIDDVGYGALRGQPHTSYAALQPGTVRSATTGEILFSNPLSSAAFGLLPPPENGRRR